MRAGVAAGASIALLALAACTQSGAPPAANPDTAAAVVNLEGPAGEHARWVVTTALGEAAVGAGELPAKFTGELLTAGGASVLSTFETVRSSGPWTIASGRTAAGGQTAELVLRSASGEHLLLHTTVDDSGRAFDFWFGHAVDPHADAADSSERAVVLERLPARAAVAVGTVRDGVCTAMETEGGTSGQRLPLASVAKLVTLDVVLDQVSAGALAWQQPLTLGEEHRSLPSGELAFAPEGTVVTVEDAVRALLLESDNTAADLLRSAVGPSAVDENYTRLSGAVPLTPFWSTREVFALGWGPMRVEGAGGIQFDVPTARASLTGRPLMTTLLEVKKARWQDGLDWFLTPAQLCSLGAELHHQWDALPEHVRTELGDGELLLRKPGTAPGVVAGLWLVDGAQGARVVTVQFASDQTTAVGDVAGLLSVGDAVAHATVSGLEAMDGGHP